ncbi:MAG: HEAT repeat domain-containing protein [Planctomycetota bacterium]|nr:HEAT repeat domain-containing protein [Planctomycetota bacterium]
MDDEFAAIERQLASDPGNIGLTRRLAQAYKRSGCLHKGRSMEEWHDILFDKNCPTRDQNHATKMLLQIGSAAIPDLLSVLSSLNLRERRRAAKLIGKFRELAAPAVPKLTELLTDCNADVARFALQSLRLIGSPSRPAIPQILAVFGHHIEGIQSLFDIDPEHPSAFDFLERSLNHEDRNTRAFAAKTLLKTGRRGQELVLTQFLRTEEPAMWSILAVLEKYPVPPAFLPKLAKVLDFQGVENVGWYAARALSRIGKPALPFLIGTLRTGSPRARRHTLQALRDLGPISLPALPIIEDSLADPDRKIRNAALSALGELGPPAIRTIPKILELIKTEESVNRKSAILALSKIAPNEKTQAILKGIIHDSEDKLSQFARQILARLNNPESSP